MAFVIIWKMYLYLNVYSLVSSLVKWRAPEKPIIDCKSSRHWNFKNNLGIALACCSDQFPSHFWNSNGNLCSDLLGTFISQEKTEENSDLILNYNSHPVLKYLPKPNWSEIIDFGGNTYFRIFLIYWRQHNNLKKLYFVRLSSCTGCVVVP